MASCQKCWIDAGNRAFDVKDKVDCCIKLLKERIDSPCSPEQQAGVDARECQKCKRRTLHVLHGECMNKECQLTK